MSAAHLNIATYQRQPKLMDNLRQVLQTHHYSKSTEKTHPDCYRGPWVKRYIYFHNVKHPAIMAEPEINAFLTHLAVNEKFSASTQNQSRHSRDALFFLYRHVLDHEVGDLSEVVRAIKLKRLPIVMTREEMKAVLSQLNDDK